MGAAASSSSTIASATVASATASTVAAATSVVTSTRDQSNVSRSVVAVRALLETSSSFRSLDVWVAALAEEEQRDMESHWRAKQLVTTMAQYEKHLTYMALKAGSIFRLQADGLDRTCQVEISTVIWQLPCRLQHWLSYGKQAGWLQQLGPRGPWIVERIIGMQEFPKTWAPTGKCPC